MILHGGPTDTQATHHLFLSLNLQVNEQKSTSTPVQRLEFISGEGTPATLQISQSLIVDRDSTMQPSDLGQSLPSTSGAHGHGHFGHCLWKVTHEMPPSMVWFGVQTKQTI